MRGKSTLALALWVMATPLLAELAPAMAEDDLWSQRRLSNEELADLRGGFMTSAGFVSFGIDMTGLVAGADGSELSSFTFQAVLENGVLVGDPEVNNVLGSQVTTAIEQTNSSIIVSLQGGAPDSNMLGDIAGSGLFSVIQNNLDNIIIQQNTGIELTLDLDMSSIQANNLANALIEAGLLGL